jgi:hypothetical protein
MLSLLFFFVVQAFIFSFQVSESPLSLAHSGRS